MKFKKMLCGCGVIIILIWSLFPIYWIILASLQKEVDLFSIPPNLVPLKFYLGAYSDLLTPDRRAFLICIGNSLIIAASAVFITLFCASLAGYALTKMRFRGVDFLLLALITAQMMPYIVFMIPLYLVFTKLKLLDTKIVIILGHTAWMLPISIWILYGFFQTIPQALEDAARIDGCSRVTALFKVILPVSTPGLFATGLLVFIYSVNEFLYPLVFTHTLRAKTMPVAISELMGRYQTNYAKLSAHSVIALLFTVLIAIFFGRYLVKGLLSGAMKG